MTSDAAMPRRPFAVVIGASAGGVNAVLALARALPRDFPAVLCLVVHIGPNPSVLPELLQERGSLPARHARDGARAVPGVIHVAPPDHHLLLEGEVLRVVRGPKENHACPAIDPLFRSAALHWRERAIGVVLSGQLDDGAAGLAAIKSCGGRAVVQDPGDAAEPGMPRAALAAVEADAVVALDGLARVLLDLVGHEPAIAGKPAASLALEQAFQLGTPDMSAMAAIGKASNLTCPECGGVVWEMGDAPPRWRCHTGHAFSAATMASVQLEAAENLLWAGVRALRERAQLLRRMAAMVGGGADSGQEAAAMLEHARTVDRKAAAITALLEEGGA